MLRYAIDKKLSKVLNVTDWGDIVLDPQKWMILAIEGDMPQIISLLASYHGLGTRTSAWNALWGSHVLRNEPVRVMRSFTTNHTIFVSTKMYEQSARVRRTLNVDFMKAVADCYSSNPYFDEFVLYSHPQFVSA